MHLPSSTHHHTPARKARHASKEKSTQRARRIGIDQP
jgi:hypothetical protein